MRKIIIVGCGGSGKSTLARKLGEMTKIPVFHLDALYWKPGWVPTPREEWHARQKVLVNQDQWIIDGNYGGTIDIRMAEADTIIFLDLPRWIAMYRVLKRRLQYHHKARPDMNAGCPEKLDWEFIGWVWRYNKDIRPGILQKLKTVIDEKTTIILRTPNEVRRFVAQVRVNADIDQAR